MNLFADQPRLPGETVAEWVDRFLHHYFPERQVFHLGQPILTGQKLKWEDKLPVTVCDAVPPGVIAFVQEGKIAALITNISQEPPPEEK